MSCDWHTTICDTYCSLQLPLYFFQSSSTHSNSVKLSLYFCHTSLVVLDTALLHPLGLSQLGQVSAQLVQLFLQLLLSVEERLLEGGGIYGASIQYSFTSTHFNEHCLHSVWFV